VLPPVFVTRGALAHLYEAAGNSMPARTLRRHYTFRLQRAHTYRAGNLILRPFVHATPAHNAYHLLYTMVTSTLYLLPCGAEVGRGDRALNTLALSTPRLWWRAATRRSPSFVRVPSHQTMAYREQDAVLSPVLRLPAYAHCWRRLWCSASRRYDAICLAGGYIRYDCRCRCKRHSAAQ